MFCVKCGKKLEDGMSFCPDCGAKQVETFTAEFKCDHMSQKKFVEWINQ